MLLSNSDIVSLGSDRISDAAPAGESVRYDAEFEQLAAEIAKLEAINTPPIDWDSVVQLSASILKAKSKDYRVAVYMLIGLYQTRGFEGLVNGFRMYVAMLKNFWETAFPEKARLRARIGSLEWFNTQLSRSLSRDARKPSSEEVILELQSAFEEFLGFLKELLADQAPGFAELRGEIDGRARDIHDRKAAAHRAKEEEARRAAASAAGEVTDVADAERISGECREKISRVAGFLYQSDPADPLSYCLSRSVTWGWITAVPANENRVTQIPPIPEEVIPIYNSLAAEKNWIGIVGETESNFFGRVFSFSLQRRCVQALAELGEQYDGARKAILTELAGLCARLPEIVKLKFVDNSPFADSETISWMEKEVLGKGFGAGVATKNADSEAAPESSELADASTAARRLMADGKLQEAIALFKDGMAKSPLRRFRFLWKLQLAKLCMEAGKLQLALPQLVSLDEDVSRFSLEEWEPGLSLEVVQNLFTCRQKLAASMSERSAEVENQLAQLYQRLCKLDVNAALAVEY